MISRGLSRESTQFTLPPHLRNLVINCQVGSQPRCLRSTVRYRSGLRGVKSICNRRKTQIPGYTFLVSVGDKLITLPHGVGFENNSVKLEGAPHAWVAYGMH
ncbi:hypothetical protein BDQ94DRAFT_137908 [Aspergillus welwitschiae]|uniref:Uncharacterized protein n=1 Tax=Aspergillus welwitschiae TaxID=1341132 RepID=A0A3F3QBG5_9EURO|nr:hypothetical protein BDQ94DRAFT_137908 [Aspergillus welwitschiae]RDH36505.1 hypothetical protein BDQ94DRAFT_137908 [Aspergillus welwitschiae]